MNENNEPKCLGKCYWCKEDIYSTEVYEFDGVLYCSTHCIVKDLMDQRAIVDLSE